MLNANSSDDVSMPVSDEPVNLYAQKRLAARLGAVQVLYQMEMTGRGWEGVLREFASHSFLPDMPKLRADREWMRILVEGVVASQDDIDPAVQGVLDARWKLTRLEATLRAILRAGAYEVLHQPEVPTAVIISNYVDVAGAFFDDEQAGFVHAALDRLAKTHRS